MSMSLAKARESRVLGISSIGLPIYAICGAEGEEEETDKNGTGEGGNGGGDGTGADGKDSQGTGEEAPRSYTAEEYETILRRMRAADEAKGKAEKRLQELDDAEKSELEKANRDLADAKARIAQMEKDITKGKMANAILQFPGYTWHDPEVVLQVIDMDLIDIDEESGKVKGVKQALDKLAKEKPYLLKGKTGSGSGDGGKDGGSNGAGQKVGSSGHSPGSERPDDKNARRKELAAKYKL